MEDESQEKGLLKMNSIPREKWGEKVLLLDDFVQNLSKSSCR